MQNQLKNDSVLVRVKVYLLRIGSRISDMKLFDARWVAGCGGVISAPESTVSEDRARQDKDLSS